MVGCALHRHRSSLPRLPPPDRCGSLRQRRDGTSWYASARNLCCAAAGPLYRLDGDLPGALHVSGSGSELELAYGLHLHELGEKLVTAARPPIMCCSTTPSRARAALWHPDGVQPYLPLAPTSGSDQSWNWNTTIGHRLPGRMIGTICPVTEVIKP